MTELIKHIEAILFSVGDKITVDEISKLTKEEDIEKIKKFLIEIRDKYNSSNSPMFLHQEGNTWKMNVREEHISTVRKVVKKMELPKTLLETLSVIAWKAPVKQSIVIDVRTNKAYDHLDELEKMGYITRKKFGRTKLINLTTKFYDYFEINKKGGLGRIFRKVTERAKLKYGDMFDKDPVEPEEIEETEKSDENIKKTVKEDSKVPEVFEKYEKSSEKNNVIENTIEDPKISQEMNKNAPS